MDMVKAEGNAMPVMSENQVNLIKNTIAKNATNDELELFLYQCQKTGLDPLAKQIYFVKYGKDMTIITSIDGYRLSATRTGQYGGKEKTVFTYDNHGKLLDATVTVYRFVKGERCAWTETADWEEYGSDKNLWKKMPKTMLAKCAEAKALRSAFPQELSGLYTQEEMDQAENRSAVTPVAPKDKAKDTTVTIYTGSPAQASKLQAHVTKQKLPQELLPFMDDFLDNKPFTQMNVIRAVEYAKKELGSGESD